jgi:hypothetical protein
MGHDTVKHSSVPPSSSLRQPRSMGIRGIRFGSPPAQPGVVHVPSGRLLRAPTPRVSSAVNHVVHPGRGAISARAAAAHLRSTPIGEWGDAPARSARGRFPSRPHVGVRAEGPSSRRRGAAGLKNDGAGVSMDSRYQPRWLRATPTAVSSHRSKSSRCALHIDPDRGSRARAGLHRGELRFLDRSRGRCAHRSPSTCGRRPCSRKEPGCDSGEEGAPIFVWNEIPTRRGSRTGADWASTPISVRRVPVSPIPMLLDLLHEQDMYGVCPSTHSPLDHLPCCVDARGERGSPSSIGREHPRGMPGHQEARSQSPDRRGLDAARAGSRARALDVPEGLLDLRGGGSPSREQATSSAAASVRPSYARLTTIAPGP